jgi:hypothetical protein
MFGSRGSYVQHFELFIPETLYLDWQKCFVFHYLSLSFIKAGRGTPIWLEDKRIAATSPSSINQAAVDVTSGEMSWDLFDYPDAADALLEDTTQKSLDRLPLLASLLGDAAFPSHLEVFIGGFNKGSSSLAIHKTTTLGDRYGDPAVRENIRRIKGFMAANTLERDKYPKAIHHLKIFKNASGKARLFYKYTPEAGTIRFLER